MISENTELRCGSGSIYLAWVKTRAIFLGCLLSNTEKLGLGVLRNIGAKGSRELILFVGPKVDCRVPDLNQGYTL